jgi:hypothetical protein
VGSCGKAPSGQRLAWRPVASSNTGGWVRRVGSAGGGKTYRRRRPINYYGIIGVVCVLGVLSVALARYDYRNPASAASKVTTPTTSDDWFAATGIFVCGSELAPLPANGTPSSTGFTAQSGGYLKINPKDSSQTGAKATLAAFVADYHGLTLSSTVLTLPPLTKGGKAVTYTNGDTCPKGTKDHGKKGQVAISYWRNLSATKVTSTNQAGLVHFSPNMLITFGFVPSGTAMPKPPDSAIAAMLAAPTATGVTTTTAPTTTTTAKG